MGAVWLVTTYPLTIDSGGLVAMVLKLTNSVGLSCIGSHWLKQSLNPSTGLMTCLQ